MHIEEKEQSLKLTLRQAWGLSVRHFIFFPSTYNGRWPVLSLAVSSSHQQHAISLLNKDWPMVVGRAEISNHISALTRT